MKDQYVGDVNDFAKYQLLRICSAFFEPTIVAWMLTAKDNRSDGGKLAYLSDPSLGAVDSELFEALSALVESGTRSVSGVQASGALEGCTFHAEPMPELADNRAAYFAALAAMASEDSLVFLDPDNGLEVKSVARTARGSERYLYWDELGVLRQRGSSVLVYQHFPRVPRLEYLERLLERLQAEMGPSYKVFASYTSHVGFLFALREDRAEAVREAILARCEESSLLSFAE